MAETIKGGLGFADPSKINPYGAKEEDLSEYQQSLQDSVNALQMRYAQPNWFNVAAGFLKPQLGGFAASLGSASQAMGENLEKQREAQLPIAQMRSQLAMSKIAMGQNKTVSEMEAARLKAGEPITPQYVSKLVNVAPDSPQAKAAQAELAVMQKNRELESSEINTRATQFGQALREIELNMQNHVYKTPEAYQAALAAAKAAYGPKEPSVVRPPNTNAVDKGGAAVDTQQPAPAGAAGTTPPPAPTATGAAAGDTLVPKLMPAPGFNPKDVGRAEIYNQEFAKLYPKVLAGTNPRDRIDLESLVREAATLKLFPSTEGVSPTTIAAAAPSATGTSATETQPVKLSWSDKSYPVAKPAVPADLDIEAKNEYLKTNTKNSTEYVNNLAALANDSSTINRRANLLKTAELVQDPLVQAWIARNSPTAVSKTIRDALASDSMPAFVKSIVQGTHGLLPTDSPKMVAQVQKYVQNLAQEQQYANQMQQAQTNKQLQLEQFSAVNPEMQPKAAMQKIAEELHKIQRLSTMPYLLEPYAVSGHTITSMLNSDRLSDYNNHWNALHRALPDFANRMELPLALTHPDAYKPGFNYESLKPKRKQ
jgi:hypothetical protein